MVRLVGLGFGREEMEDTRTRVDEGLCNKTAPLVEAAALIGTGICNPAPGRTPVKLSCLELDPS